MSEPEEGRASEPEGRTSEVEVWRPRLKTVDGKGPDGKGWHVGLEATLRPGEDPVLCCGDSWCSGKCGLPALVIPARGELREHKAYSNMTAVGPVMQTWRVTWTGEKVQVPEEHWDYLMGRYWW